MVPHSSWGVGEARGDDSGFFLQLSYEISAIPIGQVVQTQAGFFIIELTHPNFGDTQFSHACQLSHELLAIPIGQVIQTHEWFHWKNL